MKLVISKLSRKQINTKFGQKDKVSFQCGGTWYSAFSNPYTDAWADGMEIDVEVKTSQGKDGKTYHNIVFPKESTTQATPNAGAKILLELAEIKGMLNQVLINQERMLFLLPMEREPGEDGPDEGDATILY